MPTKLFVNVAVKDLARSMAYYKALGHTFNPKFTDKTAACMVLGEDNYVMLLTEPKFKQFTSKRLVDPKTSTEALLSIALESRKAVDDYVKKAVAAGGREARKAEDLGFMYNRSVEDPDGHIWEPFWMDPKAT
jgi:uncharacterized protein